jgi:predicted permease
VTIVTMAIGIGATTVLFSLTYGVLLKPLPWPNANRVLVLKETRGGNAPRFGEFTNAAYLAWREQPAVIENIAGWSQRAVTLSGNGDPERIRITAATASLFPVLGVRPLIGSLFQEQDESAPVVVLSERLWRRRFGADPGVLGTLLHFDGEPYSVVGVLPDRFAFPDRQSLAIVPFAIRSTAGNSLSMFNAVAALRPGATPAQAAAEGTARGRFAADTGLTTTAIFGSSGPIAIASQPLHEALTADVRRPLIVLLAAVALLLATATANVAGLQLARAATRIRELAIRAAIGAGARRITRQLLIENLLLGALGGLAGLALARLVHGALPSLLPADFPRSDDLTLNAAVLSFTLFVSTVASVCFGSLPAISVRRVNLVEALSENGTAPAGGGARSRTARTRAIVMSGQVAIACVLLVGASLLGRSFVALLRADRGYDAADVLAARLSMPQALYPSPERRFAIVDAVLQRLAAVPGIAAAAFTSELPLTRGGSSSAFDLKSPGADGGIVKVQASPRIVGSEYFSALSIRLVAGRTFLPSDTSSSEPVVVVNETFVQRYLGDEPLGSKLPMVYAPRKGPAPLCTVIGIVEDARYVPATEPTQPEMYYSYLQMRDGLPVQTITLLARLAGDGGGAASAIRDAVRAADGQLVVDLVAPLDQRLMTTLARPRLYAMLLGGFAGFALLVAAVGLFGLLSYSVSLRSRELAIRTAIGARRSDILRVVMQQGLAITAVGLAAGLLAASWLSGLLATQLYGITPHDTATFVIVPFVLLFAALAACAGPALKAAKCDPLQVLRQG